MRVGIFWNIQNIKILKESQLKDILDTIRKKIKYDDRDIEVVSLGVVRSKFTSANDKKLTNAAEVFIIYVDASASNATAENLVTGDRPGLR
jgi:hypothetical protein